MAMRNPIVHLVMNQIQTVGDCHLGRVFKTNVSLDRRGEYEKTQMVAFRELLFTPRPEEVPPTRFIRTQVGDLFDKAVVSNQVLLETLKVLQEYEKKCAEPLYIISGNHDDSKSTTEPTSWDILAEFFCKSSMVQFVKEWQVHKFPDGRDVLFVGWNIHQSVAQAFLEAEEAGYKPDMVICHLDRISYGNEDNVIPYDFLRAKEIISVVSGHEHKPYQFWEGEMQVIGTGSLLPYSHAEDPDGDYYVTFRSFQDIKDLNYHQIAELNDKHVRVYIEPEHMDDFLALEMNCLSLQVNKAETLNVDEAVTEVVTESYNAKEIWERSLTETTLPKDEGQLLWSEIEMKGIENDS